MSCGARVWSIRLIVATTMLVALASADVAHGLVGTQCNGENIGAQGSILQTAAQEAWSSGFNTSNNSSACDGTQGSKGTPFVEWHAGVDSGAGLESWGVDGHAPDYSRPNAFVATDEPPSASDKGEIEQNEMSMTPETLETIPVVQEAIAVIVHLPEGCAATSKWEAGRLVLNDTTLEAIFRGTIRKWNEITGDGDELTGAGCNAAAAIKPVVRTDRAGTTRIFKRFLGVISEEGFIPEGPHTGATWNEVAEGPENTTWPAAAGVTRSGSPEPFSRNDPEVIKVAETPGSIGYAALNSVRADGSFAAESGGPGTQRFWVGIQRNGPKAGTPKYADPSSNRDTSTVAQANCANTEYTNGEVPFPPADTAQPWNEVVAAVIQAKYPICGLSYIVAFQGYGAYVETSLGEATTVHDYVGYVLNSKSGGGQNVIKAGHDYYPLPAGVVLEEAQKGATKVGF